MQTLGTRFTVDGRLRGNLNITTISCDQSRNTCSIPVPAPGFALVFLGNQDEATPEAPMTFATTTSRTPNLKHNTATVNQAVLATSNGHRADDLNFDGMPGRTSPDSVKGGARSLKAVYMEIMIVIMITQIIVISLL
jgi:hypothetical protein